jgi:hypothetical protein
LLDVLLYNSFQRCSSAWLPRSRPEVLEFVEEPVVAADLVAGRAVHLEHDVELGGLLWDESTRPKGPAPEADAVYTASGRAMGRQLIGVHNHLRDELTKVRSIVGQVADGILDVGEARSEINTMTMRQNNWTMGAYCESYCRLVTLHHTLEDTSLYPQLREGDARLGPVLDRLTEEHQVIHEVLERLDAALVATVAEPQRIGEVQKAVDLLTDTLLSHLSYEEGELVEPMARIPYHH